MLPLRPFHTNRRILIVWLFLYFFFVVQSRSLAFGLFPPKTTATKTISKNPLSLSLFGGKKKQRTSSIKALPLNPLKLLFRGGAAERNATSSLPSLTSLSLSEDFGYLIGYREGLIAVGIYYLVGVIAYHVVFEKWTIVDALYFSCVCCSTVGYGDLCPTTNAGKIFACFYGFAGISIIGVAIAAIGARFHKLELDALKNLHFDEQKDLLNFYEMIKDPLHIRQQQQQQNSREGEEEKQQVVDNSTTKKKDNILIQVFSTILAVGSQIAQPLAIIVFGGILFGRLENWSWCDSMYYSIISASTIGLGDFAPTTTLSKCVATLFIPLVVASAGNIISKIGTLIIERRQRHKFNNHIMKHVHQLSMDDFQIIDRNKDGKVQREEYVLFMLTEMGLVDSYQIKELKSQFKRLDVTSSGYLDEEDLELWAQLRRKKQKEECTKRDLN